MLPAATLREAEQHLSRRDRRLAQLIQANGPCTLGRSRRDPFHVLCRSIIGQQLSLKAADTIQARIAAAVRAGTKFMPGHFLDAEPELLRGAGLSRAKCRWLIALAQVDMIRHQVTLHNLATALIPPAHGTPRPKAS